MLKPQKIFDNSMLETYRVCPRRFYWQYVRNVVLSDPQIAINSGTVLHAALEKFYNPSSTVKNPSDLYMEFFTDVENIPTQYSWPALSTLMYSYIDSHQSEPFTVQSTELGFALPIADDIIYSGRIDLDVLWKPFGTVIIDHKTTSRYGYTNSQMTYPNSQLCGYVWAKSHFTDSNIYAMINWIHILTNSFNFYRTMPILYSSHDIQTWRQSVLHTIRAVFTCYADNYWPMHTNMCYKFYGSCPYITLCMIQKAPETFDPPPSYIENVWEPFEGLRAKN